MLLRVTVNSAIFRRREAVLMAVFYAAKNIVFAISSVVNDRSFSVGTFWHSIIEPTVYWSLKSSTFFILIHVLHRKTAYSLSRSSILLYKYNEYLLQPPQSTHMLTEQFISRIPQKSIKINSDNF
jgi:hypothetical protein